MAPLRRSRQGHYARSRALLSAALCLPLCAACRSATVPEASVPAEVLEAPGEALLENVRGEWIWVTREAKTSLVTVERGGVMELFWGLDRGRRSVELIPITRVPRAWFIETTSAPHRIAFVDVADVARLSGFDDPIALVDEGGELRWLGAAPAGATRAVALSTRLEAFPEHPAALIAASLDVDGSSWEGRGASSDWVPATPHVAVLDGPARADVAPREANFALTDRADSIARRALGALDAASTFHHQLGHAGLTAGADVVRVRLLDSTLIGLTAHMNPTSAPGMPLPPALVAEPLALDVAGFSEALDALAIDLHNARWLSASTTLDSGLVSVHGEMSWARLRTIESFAAAGYPQWTRRALYADQTYAQAPDFLYVGRGYLLSGDYELAAATLRRAEVAFNLWSGRASAFGQARARALRARAYAGLGDLARARALAEVASERYASNDDWLAAGSTAALAARFAFADSDPDDSLRLLKIARGYLFHSGAPRASADIELAIAEVYLTLGDLDSSDKMTDYALRRYERMEDTRGARRALILENLLTAWRSPARVSPSFFQGAERAAMVRGDVVAARSAIASHVLARRYEEPALAERWLDALREGVAAHRGDYLEPRLSRALALTCAQRPLASQGDAARTSDCDDALGRVTPTPALFDALMTRAWVHLQREDAARAARARDLTLRLFDDDARARVPHADARLLLLDAALADAASDPGAAESLRARATSLIASAHGDLTRADELSDLAEVSLARGERRAARALATSAYESSVSARQPDQRARAARLVHDACAQLADWACARDASSRAAASASGVDALEARARAARASHMLGDRGARRALEAALDDALELPALDAMAALTHGARAAASMGLQRLARDTIARVRALEAGLDDALYDPLVGGRIRAGVEVLDARVLAEDGDWRGAALAARRADEALVADPSHDAVFIRLEALYWRARTAPDEDTYAYAIREVERLRARRLTTDARVLSEAARASAEIVSLSGDSEFASRILDELHLLGYDTPPVWRDVPCLVERVLSTRSGDFAPLRACARALPRGSSLVDPLIHWSVLSEGAPEDLGRAHSACVSLGTSLERGAPLWSPESPGALAGACARGETQRARRIAQGLGASNTSLAHPAPRATKKSP